MQAVEAEDAVQDKKRGPGKQRQGNRGRTNAEFCAEPFACSFLTARRKKWGKNGLQKKNIQKKHRNKTTNTRNKSEL